MIDTLSESVDLASFNQLVHELIGGEVRRHKFTSHEMELLLDLHACGIRKSARAELLRRYLKVLQQRAGQGDDCYMRLSLFIEISGRKRDSSAMEGCNFEPGLSSR